MKNACKHFALCTLTLILCLALAACGSDNSGDSADYGNDSTVPSTIDGFVKESYDSYDYSAFEGYYLPDSGTDFDYLIIDTNGSRWRIGNNDDLAASGYLQYDADYDCIYAYNEHDGVAYQFSADGSSVNIYSLGSFTYEMSLDEFDAQAEDYNSSDSSVDLSYLAGIWYLDGAGRDLRSAPDHRARAGYGRHSGKRITAHAPHRFACKYSSSVRAVTELAVRANARPMVRFRAGSF